MKKCLALILALLMVLPAFAMTEEFAGTIKIGVFEPASGDNGAGGKQEVLGMKYANSIVNTVEIGGKLYKLELDIVDNQSATDKAISAAKQLVNDGVSVVLGSYGSGVSIAAGDIFEAAKTPAIGASCTNPGVTNLNEFYFRVCFLDPFQGTVMANFAKEEIGAGKVYILTQLGNDYDVGLGNYFSQAFKALGGEVVEESFPEGNSDFSAYIQNAKNAGCDAIFSPTSTTYASLIIGQAASAGIEMPILAGDTWESSVILDAAKGTNLKVCLSTFFDEHDESSTVAADFVTGFKAYLNSDGALLTDNGGNDIVAAVSALGYDAYMVAAEAIKLAGSAEGEAIQKVMWDVEYSGVTGSITFDELGDAKKDMAYIKTVNVETGAFEFIKTQSIADLGK